MVIIKEVMLTILKPVLVTTLADSKPPNPREIGQIPLMLSPARWQHNSSRPGLKAANSSNASINSNFNNNNNRKWLGKKKKVQLSVLPDVKLGLNLAFFMAASLSRERPTVIAPAPAGRAVAAAASYITMNRPVQPLD